MASPETKFVGAHGTAHVLYGSDELRRVRVSLSVGIVVYDIVRSGRSSQLRDVTSNEYELIGGFGF